MNDYGTSLIVSPGVEVGAIEARTTLPEGPGYSATGEQRAALEAAFFSLGYSDEYHEQHVNHDTAFSYSAFWGCVQVISQSLAGLGWHAYEKKEGSPRFRFPIEDDVAWTLNLQANPEMTAFTWREVMLKDALVGGNGYSEIERTKSGKFLWLWRLDPDRVTPQRNAAGRLYYEIDNGPGEDPTLLPPENMFHLKGPSPDGLVGWDVVNLAKRAIKLGMAEERFGCDFFGRGPMPGGMVTVPGNMTKEQRREFRRSFEEVYSGPRNAHRIVVLSNQVKFDPSNLPNDSAQFLESRAFQALEICRFFRVPPHKLADLTRATFSNIEEQEREFVTDCLLPWARRLESEADIKAFGLINRGRRFTRLNLDALMRGNSATQTQTVTAKVNSAIFTVNEAREYFELNPIEGGDTPLVQGAMAPLERILEEPEPAPPPSPPAPQKDANGKAPPVATLRLRDCEDPIREADGQFAGCNPSTDKDDDETGDDHQAQRDTEDTDRQASRDDEDQALQEVRDNEDLATDSAREKEEASTIEKRDGEDSARDKKREDEDSATQANRDREDETHGKAEETVSNSRAAEDSDIATKREAEDNATQEERDKEDEAHEASGEALANARDDEDAARADQRNAEDIAIEEAHEKGEITGEQRQAQHSANDRKREKEDQQIERQRQSEDNAREKARESREKAREKEDTQKQTAREKEDEAREVRREREDATREKAREKVEQQREQQDATREKAREKEDEARDRQREREDEATQKRYEKEDGARDRRREREDNDLQKKRDREDADLQTRRDKEDKQNSRKGKTENRAQQIITEPPRGFEPLFADLYQRILDGEDSAATRNGARSDPRAWAARNYSPEGPASSVRVAERLQPLVEAFLAACAANTDPAELARLLAADHIAASLQSVSETGKVNRGRAAAQAEAHVKLLWESATKGD